MISYLTDKEIQNVKIDFRVNKSLSEAYIEERELIWLERISKTKKLGKSIWNGTIYTIEKLIQIDEENIYIVMGDCEFKDIVFRISKGVPYIIEKYGVSHVPIFITLDCIPITTDGKFVFGLRGNNTNVENECIGLIGGTANKDEMEIHSIEEFSQFMVKEIEEETLIKVRDNKLSLFSLNQFNSKYEFLYTLQLDISSENIHQIHKNDEFTDLLCMSKTEVENYEGSTLDAFRYVKTYIKELGNRY